MAMPNFFIIGAMRSGTTALYHYVKQHPDIFMSPIKEPNFFAAMDRNIDEINHPYTVRTLTEYLQLFKGSKGERAIGEASHCYLYSTIAPKRIKEYVPHAKVIAILRNPIERAYSHFMFLSRIGRETIIDFEEAIKQEEERIARGCDLGHYIKRGFYYQQLRRYYELFDSRQIKVLLYDDFKNEPKSVLKTIYQFLHIDTTFTSFTKIESHISGKPRSKTLQSLLRTAQRRQYLADKLPPKWREKAFQIGRRIMKYNIKKIPIQGELRRRLIEVYSDDITQLQELIGRDLSSWLR